MFGWLKVALNVGLKVASFIKGESKPTLSQALPFALGQLLPAVEALVTSGGMNTQEKFDGWLDTIDVATGTDSTAIDFIKDLPDEKEEQLFDHLKEAARIYGYCLIGVPGFKQ